MLSAFKQLGLTLGKVLLGHAFGVVSQKLPAEVLSGDTLVRIAEEIAKTDLGATADGLTGEQKRRFVARIVEQLILRSPIGQGKKLYDPAKFRAAVEHMTGDFADVLNAFKLDAVETKDVS